MFGFLFGWRKASKCKKLIKQLQCRLKLLKNKRCSIVRLLREDVAELIKIGHEEIALNRAEQLFQDENTMAVYELLDNFCEFIRMNMSYIRKHKDIPNDINEAVCSLAFASSRCGELPELRVIRKLFEEHYDQRFAVDTAELFPGNLVNCQIKERLSITSVPEDVKIQLVDKIARDYCLRPKLLTLEYTSELQQVLENNVHKDLDKDVYTCYSSSIVRQSSPDASDSPMIDKAEVEHGAGDHTKERQIKGRNNAASYSESSPQCHEEGLVYLDDIEEIQSSMRKDGHCQDQRLFKFKVLPKPEIVDGCNESSMGWYESLSEKSSSRSSRKSVKASGKQPWRRSLSRESSFIKDIKCEIFYQKPCKSPANKHRSHHHRKQQKNSAVEESRQSSGNLHMRSCHHCSLEHSCYCCIDDDEKEMEFLPCKLQIVGRNSDGCPIYDIKCENAFDHLKHGRCFQYRGLGDIEKPSLPQKARGKSYDNGATEYNVFTYRDRWPNGNAKEESNSPRRCAASMTGKKPKPPYLTVKTMPPERTKENCRDNNMRCSSFPCQYPYHVHPKLPDYDDIAAKFMALKKERLQNKC